MTYAAPDSQNGGPRHGSRRISASYLMIHEYGMPPHGGLGIGLERLLMTLLTAETNVRQATLFPRDMARLDP